MMSIHNMSTIVLDRLVTGPVLKLRNGIHFFYVAPHSSSKSRVYARKLWNCNIVISLMENKAYKIG